jgi:hypothetical protein
MTDTPMTQQLRDRRRRAKEKESLRERLIAEQARIHDRERWRAKAAVEDSMRLRKIEKELTRFTFSDLIGVPDGVEHNGKTGTVERVFAVRAQVRFISGSVKLVPLKKLRATGREQNELG